MPNSMEQAIESIQQLQGILLFYVLSHRRFILYDLEQAHMNGNYNPYYSVIRIYLVKLSNLGGIDHSF